MEKLNKIQHGQFKLEALIKKFNPYFFTMASNYTTSTEIKLDLIAEANVSLWQSNEKYDNTKGTTFFTYIIQNVRFNMLNFLNFKNTNQNTIFVPIRQREEFNLTKVRIDSSIIDNKPFSDTIADIVCEDTDDERIIHLKRFMKELPKKHRDIMEIKYEGYSDTEMAQMTGLTKQRIGQIVDYNIKKLQKSFLLPQLGLVNKKHTGLSIFEKQLRQKHNML